MKKLFLMFSFALLGTFLFNSTAMISSNTIATFSVSCSNWVQVVVGCPDGTNNTFYLCGDNYETREELYQAIEYFASDRC